MKRLLVTGSRSWTDANLIRVALKSAVLSLGVPASEVTLVHGGARGADLTAARCGQRMNMMTEAYPANWTTCSDRCQHGLRRNQPGRAYCPDAGYLRNAIMIASIPPGSLTLAFAMSVPSGTSGCAQVARQCDLTVVDWGADTTVDRRSLIDRWTKAVQSMRCDLLDEAQQ